MKNFPARREAKTMGVKTRCEPTLHARCTGAAEAQGVTLSKWSREAWQQRLAREEGNPRNV